MAISRRLVIDVCIGQLQPQSHLAYGCLVGVYEGLRSRTDGDLIQTFAEYLCEFYEQGSRDSYLQHVVDLSVRVRGYVKAMTGMR